MTKNVNFNWLAPRAQKSVPVTFGAPWARGALKKGESLTMTASDDTPVAAQTKHTAYWPDGSVKWTAHSALLDADKSYTISKGIATERCEKREIIAVQHDDESVTVKSSLLDCRIERGSKLITSLRRCGMKPMETELFALIETVEKEEDCITHSVRRFSGDTRNITLEESGPVRAVVKLEGTHLGTGLVPRKVFPFCVRLYFYGGSDEVKMVHSFTFNINEDEEFLKGIAVQIKLAASGEQFNRHVGFTGETGLFYEGVQGMYGAAAKAIRSTTNPIVPGSSPLRRSGSGVDEGDPEGFYERQQREGQFISLNRKDEQLRDFAVHIDDNAAWNDYRISQDSCDHYSITKRATEDCAYITAAQGNRAGGTVFFGSESGIFACALKDFWQKCPTALEINGTRGNNPRMTAWLYSRYAETYDFRAYDKVSHKHSYGGVNNDPEGIANTNEVYLKLFEEMPGKQPIIDFSNDAQSDSLLIADSSVYQDTAVFGRYWCPPTDKKYTVPAYESALLNLVYFYLDEVEQRRWYGFWDYGDVMHTYDWIRHCWRYDVGGYAWHNTELCNTYVNWLMFLRTGDYKIFRFARAMSRHCSEVDVYHSGKYAMLGTRHNVRHWGCGAKEVRISMAGHHRFFYYLTGDERIGDVMDEVKDADFATIVGRDPMQSYFEPHEKFSHIRLGPDWSSFVINWMTRWERFEDVKYRDKLLHSIDSLKQAPLRMVSGSTFHYDPTTGEMHYMGAPNIAGHEHLGDGNYQQHMVICFGGPEIWFELSDLLQDQEFNEMFAQLCSYYPMTPEERKHVSRGLFDNENMGAWSGDTYAIRMIAHSAYWYNKECDMVKALDYMNPETFTLKLDDQGNPIYKQVPAHESPRTLREVPQLSTNAVAQWSLNYMETCRLRELHVQKNR